MIFNQGSGGANGIKLASIAITTPPTKTVYNVGETFDTTGMVVTATYTNGATLAVGGYTVSPQTMTMGTTSVTITYTEGGVSRTATQAVTARLTAYTSAQPGVTYTNGFSGLTTAQISEIAEAISNNSSITNTTSEIWVNGYNNHVSIGDTIYYSMDNTLYPFRVMGFNHYALSSSTAYGAATATGKAGILMQMVGCFNTKQKMKASMASTDGWHNSYLRTWMNGTMLGYLPSATQSAIKQVNISTAQDVSTATLNTTADKLFLPAEVEVFGSAAYAKGGTNEGTRYAWYKANDTAANRVKKVNGSAYGWWERSPDNWYSSTSVSIFCNVNSNGSTSNSYVSDARGVAPCFCF